MSLAKEEIRKLLDTLPENTTFEEVQYHIYVRQRIAQGLDDLETGRVVTQEDARRRLAKWLDK